MSRRVPEKEQKQLRNGSSGELRRTVWTTIVFCAWLWANEPFDYPQIEPRTNHHLACIRCRVTSARRYKDHRNPRAYSMKNKTKHSNQSVKLLFRLFYRCKKFLLLTLDVSPTISRVLLITRNCIGMVTSTNFS